MAQQLTEQHARAVVQLVRQPLVSIVRCLRTLVCLLVLLENFVKILRAEQETALDARAENGQPRLGSPLMPTVQTCVQQEDGLLPQV